MQYSAYDYGAKVFTHRAVHFLEHFDCPLQCYLLL